MKSYLTKPFLMKPCKHCGNLYQSFENFFIINHFTNELLSEYKDFCPNCLDEEARLDIYDSQLMLVINAHVLGLDFEESCKKLEILREYLQLNDSLLWEEGIF